MKNQKGVTLIVLATTVAIIAIILGSISYTSVGSMRMRSYYNMCADIELLEEKIALYYLQHKTLPILQNETKSIDEIISNYSETNPNYNPNNSKKLCKIDLSKLQNLSLTNTEFYIDEKSHTIYISHGIKVDDEIYYTVPLEYEKIDLKLYQSLF